MSSLCIIFRRSNYSKNGSSRVNVPATLLNSAAYERWYLHNSNNRGQLFTVDVFSNFGT